MVDRGPLAELDELLSDGAPAAVAAPAAAPHVVPAMQVEPARALAEVPAVSVDGVPAVPIKQRAERLSRKMLAALETQFDRGELDATDVMNLLPKVHKVKIDEEKVELARNDGRDNLPTLHITFEFSGAVHAHCTPPPHIEVVEAVEVVEQVSAEQLTTAAPTGLDSSGLFSIELQPIDGAFES